MSHQPSMDRGLSMKDVAIRVEGLGKRYRLGRQQPYKTLRESLAGSRLNPRNWRRRQDPGPEQIFWALRHLSFDIEAGEVVGIVGRNGAGKSTLLKILSQITEPTEGRALLQGRVGSLLEVGTGFHPELSGRENIYLNGAILGMAKDEIQRKFDDIVGFAEVEKFIDTAVKHYSSGMYLRLAFSLAAHLEPEILLVDEVLAVGDAAFQQRCLGKMNEVAQTGRTVLFVSHNMGAVRRLCHSGVLLENGQLVEKGPIEHIISRYTEGSRRLDAEVVFDDKPDCDMPILGCRLLDAQRQPRSELDRMQPFLLEVSFAVHHPLRGAHLALMLDRADGTPVLHSLDLDNQPESILDRATGRYRTTFHYPGGIFNAGLYKLRIATGRYPSTKYDYCEPFVFELFDQGSFAAVGAQGKQRQGVVCMALETETERLP